MILESGMGGTLTRFAEENPRFSSLVSLAALLYGKLPFPDPFPFSSRPLIWCEQIKIQPSQSMNS